MMAEEYNAFCAEYPICSIEDGLAENDWHGWKVLTDVLGEQRPTRRRRLVRNSNRVPRARDQRKGWQRDPHQTEPSWNRHRNARHDPSEPEKPTSEWS